MEHYRPKIGNKREGYYRGYYCGRCGAPGRSMIDRVHRTRTGICLSNPKMVGILEELNTPEAEAKREFIKGLKRGKGAQRKNRKEWEKVI